LKRYKTGKKLFKNGREWLVEDGGKLVEELSKID
jgi:hypothetical protein